MIKEKIIILKGGLGNQLFQYSFGKYLEKKFKYKIIFNISNYQNKSRDKNLRQFELGKYLNSINIDKSLFNFSKFQQVYEKLSTMMIKRNIQPPFNILNGYWQDIEFARGLDVIDLNKDLTIPLSHLKEEYFFLHGRFGDYKSSPVHYCLDSDYFLQGIKYLHNKFDSKNLKFYAISDDLDYFKSILKKNIIDADIEYLNLDTYASAKLMINSKGGVCSNSTFSWWFSYLSVSDNNNFVFPKLWLKNKNIYELNLKIPNTKIV